MGKRFSIFVIGLALVCSVHGAEGDVGPDQKNCDFLIKALLDGVLYPDTKKTQKSVESVLTEIKGLNHDGVVAWKQPEMETLRFKMVRYHGVEEFAFPLPKFDTRQPLGPARVRVAAINFSQIACKNESEGGYTVIDNAKALKDGSLSVTKFPKLRVWRDVNGDIWTLDHRRLAAMKLSGVIDTIDVEFVSEAMVREQAFKYDTKSDGDAIFVRLERPDETPLAIVIADDNAKIPDVKNVHPEDFRKAVGDKNSFDEILVTVRKKHGQKALTERGRTHVNRIRYYAHELARSLDVLDNYQIREFSKSYGNHGAVSVTGRTEKYLLAKLVEKDVVSSKKSDEGVASLKTALETIDDGVEAEVQLKLDDSGRVSNKDIQGVVDQLVRDIQNGVRVTEIKNYRTREGDGLPYLSDTQVEQIKAADAEYILKMQEQKAAGKDVKVPVPVIIRNGDGAVADFSTFQADITYPSGIQLDLELRGPELDRAFDSYHLIQDIQQGRPLGLNKKLDRPLKKVVRIIRNLSSGDRERLLEYYKKKLKLIRLQEVGKSTNEKVELPAGIPAGLSFEKLGPLVN